MTTPRKTPQTWIDAGLAALKKSGPNGLKAEVLARDIGATKGSFYWHFKDVPAFHSAVLAQWSQTATDRFAASHARAETPLAQLRALAHYSQKPIDRAVRAWALHHTGAKKTVGAVDAHILHTVQTLLAQQGATHPDFPLLVHAALLGRGTKDTRTETLIDLLLVLK